MFKWIISLLASVSAIFTAGTNKSNIAPLNSAIIAYQQTYYAPAVADLGNFPRAHKTAGETALTESEKAAPITASVISQPKSFPSPNPIPTPTPTPPLSAPASPAPTIPPQDSYLATPAPIVDWLNMNLTLKGNGLDGDRTLPEITFDREYWRIEVFAYWASNSMPPKPATEKDYFKLEIYEKGTDKLIYTMTSETDDAFHKYQYFRKPGTYYFKVYTKNPSEWEISFVVSPKLAK